MDSESNNGQLPDGPVGDTLPDQEQSMQGKRPKAARGRPSLGVVSASSATSGLDLAPPGPSEGAESMADSDLPPPVPPTSAPPPPFRRSPEVTPPVVVRQEKPSSRRRVAPSGVTTVPAFGDVSLDWFPDEVKALCPEGLEGEDLVRYALAAFRGRQSASNLARAVIEAEQRLEELDAKVSALLQVAERLYVAQGKILAKLESPSPISSPLPLPTNMAMRSPVPAGLNLANPRPTMPPPQPDLLGSVEESDRAAEREWDPEVQDDSGRQMTQADVQAVWDFVQSQIPPGWQAAAKDVTMRRLREWSQPGAVMPSRWTKFLWMDIQSLLEPPTAEDGGSPDGVIFDTRGGRRR